MQRLETAGQAWPLKARSRSSTKCRVIECMMPAAVKFAVDLYGAFPVKRLFWVVLSFLFGAGKAVFRPVACNQVPGARGRGQGTETLAELGGLPPGVAGVPQRLDAGARGGTMDRETGLSSKLQCLTCA